MFPAPFHRRRSPAASRSIGLAAASLGLCASAACRYPDQLNPDAPTPDGATVDGMTTDGHAPDAATPDAADPRIPTVPELLMPFHNARVGSVRNLASLHVAFSWRPSTSAVPAELTYRLELATDPTFSSEVVEEVTPATTFTPETPLPVRMTAPVGARYYWRVRACGPEGLCSPFSAPRRVDVGRSDRDVNGDGFDDLVISGSDVRALDATRAYVYLGGHQLDSVADGRLSQESYLGADADVASGDVNGDGYADIVMSMQVVVPGGAAGRVHVYLGGPGDTFEASVDAVLTGEDDQEGFGASVAVAGDINGDGYADIVVGAPRSFMPGVPGRAYVFFGGPGNRFDAVVDNVIAGMTAEDELGRSVAGAGDVNGDGFADVIIGSPKADVGKGRADVFLGGPDGISNPGGTLAGDDDVATFGYVVAAAGDVNGDDFPDIIVSAPPFSGPNPGRVYVYLGGPGRSFDAAADGALDGIDNLEYFGTSVATAGDVNGDGHADIVIGATGAGDFSHPGRAYVFHGRPGSTFDPVPAGVLIGPSRDWFGSAVASAGDIDDDGLADVAVTSPVSLNGPVGPGAIQGRVDIFRGRPGPIFGDDAPFTILGAERGSFGHSVAP